MRREIKIGIGIGVLVIILGIWYVNSSSPDEQPERSAQTVRDSGQDQAVPVLAKRSTPHLADDDLKDSLSLPSEKPTLGIDKNSGSVASPPPSRFKNNSERPLRPALSETTEPVDDTELTERTEPEHTKSAFKAADETPSRPQELTNRGDDRLVSGNRREKQVLTPIVRTPATRPAVKPPAIEALKTAQATATRPAVEKLITFKTPTEPVKEHVVQAGDTFISLATKYLGHAKYASLISKANPGVLPHRLRVGMKIKIPAIPPEPAHVSSTTSTKPSMSSGGKTTQIPAVPNDRAYKVQAGEGWYDLAKKFLGEGNRWPELYELNRERVSNNPHLLRTGTVIELPQKVASAVKP